MIQEHVTVVIPGFNNKTWYKKNLDSIFNQNYSNFDIIYTDDCSTDGTNTLVSSYINGKNNINFIKNVKRIGALENLFNMINLCADDDIIITVDADDWLPHNKVISRVVKEYTNNNTWLTYGRYKEHPHNTIGCSAKIPPKVVEQSSYRSSGWYSSHLRTFKAWLFKKIKKEDLMHNGEFFPSAWDLALFFPMLEMSGVKARFISDILYMYNTENPINDHKVDPKQQQNLARVIRNKNKYMLL